MRGTRARAYSRAELRRLRRSWRRRNAKVLLILAAAAAALLAATTALFPVPDTPSAWSWYGLGAAHAGTVLTLAFLAGMSSVSRGPAAVRHLRGASSQEYTRDALRRARRRRLIWGWVDGLSLQAGGVEHLIVTRRGGLVAVESTWRHQPSDAAVAEIVRVATRGRHRAHAPAMTVRPLVVSWGPAYLDGATSGLADADRLVAGDDLLAWLRRLNGQPVSRGVARDLLRRVRAYRVRPASASPPPGTPAPATARD